MALDFPQRVVTHCNAEHSVIAVARRFLNLPRLDPVPQRPLILAHRGAREVAPENTLAAFRAARELGADGVELDVALSADRVPVVIHDLSVDRTTDGTGLVRELTVAQLQRLNAGSWKAPRFATARIPTLDETLDALPDLTLNIELKTTAIVTDGLERLAVECIARRQAAPRVIVSSFNPLALLRVRLLDPTLATGLLYHERLPRYLRRAWLRTLVRPAALHPRFPLLTRSSMRWASQRGYRVHTWTVNDEEQMRRCIALGVDAIITDAPDRLRAMLDGSQLPGAGTLVT